MWKNKHVVIALLVAPVLAVIAWFAVDRMVAEEPQAAQPGGAYELVAKPNCRYASGECELVNNEFRLRLYVKDSILYAEASHSLDGLQIAFVLPDGSSADPIAMSAIDTAHQSWGVTGVFYAHETLRVLARADGASYYAETSLAFTGEPDGV